MRNRTSERGASYWPFIIALVLLLVFVFLWFDRKSEAEKFEKESKELAVKVEAAIVKLGAIEEYAGNLSTRVGWLAPDAALGNKQLTNLAEFDKAIALDGAGSQFVAVRDAATQVTTRAMYKGTAATPAAVQIAQISDAFQQKIAAVIAANPGDAPTPPKDADDAAGKAAYESSKKEYDGKFQAYKALVEDALKDKEFPTVEPVLGAVNTWTLDKLSDAVKWVFVEQPSVPSLTVEDLLKLPAPAFVRMREAWTKAVNEQMTTIKGLTAEKAERDGQIENLQKELAQAQADRTTDVTKLTKEASDAKEVAEKARVESENLRNLGKQAEEKARLDLANLATANTALKNRIQADKEVLDAEIARDDRDGWILAANNSQGIVYIDLGTADKVYAGLKMSVWNDGQGGVRVPKGEIVITQVLDVHYAQARISAQVAMLSAKDQISNPFFRKDRQIRLFLAGDLKKYPRAIAIERLKRMNVVIDEQISSETDYVLIPSGIAAAPAAAPAEGGAAPAETEFDKLQKLARSFGANLITEPMISAFLDY